jgi:hypothetical protein
MQAADGDDAAFGAALASFTPVRPAHEATFFRTDDAAAGAASGDEMTPNAGETDGRFIVIPNVL